MNPAVSFVIKLNPPTGETITVEQYEDLQQSFANAGCFVTLVATDPDGSSFKNLTIYIDAKASELGINAMRQMFEELRQSSHFTITEVEGRAIDVLTDEDRAQ